MADFTGPQAFENIAGGIGGVFSGSLEFANDFDLVRFFSFQGLSFTIYLQAVQTGLPTGDAFLRVLDGTGAVLASDDDGGATGAAAGSGNSLITFVAPSQGDFFISAQSLSGVTGSYEIAFLLNNAPSFTQLSAGADTVELNFNMMGNQGSDRLTGGFSANNIFGGLGDDSLFGLGQNDLLNGGAGDDHLDGGTDQDTLVGGDGNDWLEGGEGADQLLGGSGSDLIEGGNGNDTLDGQGGVDVLSGGADNDTYIVDGDGDTVIEAVGGGSDTVKAFVSFFLSQFAEVETLRTADDAGTGFISLTGNGFAQQIIGNAGNNFLSDGVDSVQDFLVGGAGNDSYFIGVSDLISDTSGIDLVTSFGSINLSSAVSGFTTIENVTLAGFGVSANGNTLKNVMTGNELGNLLTGLGGADRLSGLAGADTLSGGTGNDTLAGGTGNDAFLFSESLSSLNRDTITDFSNVTGNNDVFRLENAIFTKLTATGALNPGFFLAGTVAFDSNDFIVYNKLTGALFYDSNANAAGGAVQIATLSNKATLSAADFFVV
jgi:Ca2+-binding RTX toxin-like protein